MQASFQIVYLILRIFTFFAKWKWKLIETCLNCQRSQSSLKIFLVPNCSPSVGKFYLRINLGLRNVGQQPLSFLNIHPL